MSSLQPQFDPQHYTLSLYKLFPFSSATLSNFHIGSSPLKIKEQSQPSCSFSCCIYLPPHPFSLLSQPVRKDESSRPRGSYHFQPKIMFPHATPPSAMNYLTFLKYLQPSPSLPPNIRNLPGISLLSSKLDSI